MNSLINFIKRPFREGNTVMQIVFINVIVYFVVALTTIALSLFNIRAGSFVDTLQLSSVVGDLVKYPWSIITYMFLHFGLLHLFFNMLCLYWFGQIFLMNFTPKQFVGVYVIGGLAGGVFFVFCYTFVPLFAGKLSLLCGASASIICLIVAQALTSPQMPLRLLFLGEVKLKYIAIVAVLISFLGINSSNAGGEIAHLGGALGGLLWFLLLKRNIDISKPIGAILSFVSKIFGKKNRDNKRARANKFHYVKSDEAYNVERKKNSVEMDSILDKIKKSGYDSLSEKEKKRLFDISNNL